MVQPLAWPLVEKHGVSVLARRLEAHGLVPARDVDEAEVLVVSLPDCLVRHLQRVVQERSHRHDRPPRVEVPGSIRYASFTVFSSAPSPVISRRIVSPGCSVICGLRENPTPAGVPVAMRSPGASVMMFVRYWMM